MRLGDDDRHVGEASRTPRISIRDVGQLPNGAWFMVLGYPGHAGHPPRGLLGARMTRRSRSLIEHLVSDLSSGLDRATQDRRAIVQAYARDLREAEAEAAQRALAPMRDVPAGSRYQLGDRLGTGGMAEVYAGTMIGAEGFARRVAIKRVRSSLAEIPAFARMFIAEAQIASRLAHPNIVSVLDFTRDPEDRLFLVMEYVDGKDLASVLATGPVPVSLAIFIVVEMLRALDYAHDLPHGDGETRGVIHRDVSPQNLLLSYEGAVKVSDFGLAKVRVASDGVRSETVRGKPSYMAPEQMAGQLLDGRADLYAVGVMLWEMLAQRPLYAGTAQEIMAQALFKDLPRPSSVRRGVPLDVEAVAMRLLARDPAGRPASAQLAIEALLQCGDVPRDGRGELADLLAARFPTAAGARPSRRSVPGGAVSSPGALRGEPAPSPPSTIASLAGSSVALGGRVGSPAPDASAAPASMRAARSRHRWIVAAILAALVLGWIAAARAANPHNHRAERDDASPTARSSRDGSRRPPP